MLNALIALYAASSAMHFALVARHGIAGNIGTLVFAFIYGGLALAVLTAIPYALWAGLVLTLVGITGLSLNFLGIAKTVPTGLLFWAVDAAVIGITLYLLFA